MSVLLLVDYTGDHPRREMSKVGVADGLFERSDPWAASQVSLRGKRAYQRDHRGE